MTKPKTWKEAKALGWKRCCATFTSGRQCRKRAEEGSGFCKKHGPMIEAELRKYHCPKCDGICKGNCD